MREKCYTSGISSPPMTYRNACSELGDRQNVHVRLQRHIKIVRFHTDWMIVSVRMNGDCIYRDRDDLYFSYVYTQIRDTFLQKIKRKNISSEKHIFLFFFPLLGGLARPTLAPHEVWLQQSISWPMLVCHISKIVFQNGEWANVNPLTLRSFFKNTGIQKMLQLEIRWHIPISGLPSR